MKMRKWIILMLCSNLALLPACATTDSRSAAAVAATDSFAEKYTNAWVNHEPDVLSPLFSDDLIGFDAMLLGWSYDHQEAEKMLRDPSWWGNFQINKGTEFVSPDGSFFVVSTTIDYYNPNLGRIPNIHLIALKNGLVIFSYDYYCGVQSKTEPLPLFEPSNVEPGSPKAQKLVEQATETVKKWQKAFNDRDIEGYLSCFAESAKHIDTVTPDWRVLTKTELITDVTSRFSRSEFATKLVASSSSPIPDGFFVSADGHYVVAQGTYTDTKVRTIPMVVILEIDAGKIVKQYNFTLADMSQLQP